MKDEITYLLILLCFLASCTHDVDSSTSQTSDVNSEQVSLQLEVLSKSLAPNESLDLQLEFTNHTNSNISVIRPLDGSWEPSLRQPHYILEFVDDKDQLVQNVLGAQPPRMCGLVNPLQPEDIFDLAPSDNVQVIVPGAFRPYQQVQSTARPGKYRMRVRYKVDAVSEATPLEVVSNEVEIVVNGGNSQLWECYQNQLYLQQNHSSTGTSVSNLLPNETDFFLLYTRFVNNVVNGQSNSYSELYLQQLDEYAEPKGDEILLIRESSIGNVESITVPDGILVVLTPSRENGRALEIVHVTINNGNFYIDRPQIISHPPGNPYFLGLARYGEVVGLAYEGNEAKNSNLVFQLLDTQGVPLDRPQYVTDTIIGRINLIATIDGFLLGWNERQGNVGLLQLDRTGKPVEDVQRVKLDKRSYMVKFWLTEEDEIHMTVQDNAVSSNDPTDTTGFYLVRLQKDGELIESHIPLTPLTDGNAHFDTTSIVKETLGRVVEVSFNELWFDIFSKDTAIPPVILSKTVNGFYEFETTPDQFVIAWDDYRDDTSKGCTLLGNCASEVYISIFDKDGLQRVPPKRITEIVQPPPFLFTDYERFCQTDP